MKKVLFDTSVLVAGLISTHESHKRCLNKLQKVVNAEVEGCVSAHTLVELYAVLTRLPAKPRISPSMAAKLVQDNIETHMKIISLSASEYRDLISEVAALDLSGGVIYDAIIAKCGQQAAIDELLTLNPNDFHRVWPQGKEVISVP